MASRAKDTYDEVIANKDNIEAYFQKKIDGDWLEQEYLDFKSRKIIDEHTGKKKYQPYRECLCEVTSAFANTEGGVVIFGVEARKRDDKRDVAYAFEPFNDCNEAFDKFRDYKLNLTYPLMSGILVEPIPRTPNSKAGYLVMYIPKGEHGPYRGEFHGAYHQRTHDSAVIFNHEILRNLFYPKSTPEFEVTYTVEALMDNQSDNWFQMSVRLKNTGNATAENVFVETIISPNSPLKITDYNVNEFSIFKTRKTNRSYVKSEVELKRVLHPQQDSANLFTTRYDKEIVEHTYNLRDGGLSQMTDVVLPSGIDVRMRVFCRDKLVVGHHDSISWEQIQTGHIAKFPLVYQELSND